MILLSVMTAVISLPTLAHADFVPTHGFGPHLDPFVPGPVAAGVVGPLAAGGPGEIVPPFAPGVPWAVPFTAPAADAIADPLAIWHWESEIDVPALVGLVPVSFNGAAPVLITFGPGSDLYYHANQPDLAGSIFPFVVAGEIGPVWKQLVNLTPFPVAWGTSVGEDLGMLGYREAVELQVSPGILPPLAPIFGYSNIIELSFDPLSGTLGFTEIIVPEPTSGWLLVVGATASLLIRRRRSRALKLAPRIR
jgi:hypothetical protein